MTEDECKTTQGSSARRINLAVEPPDGGWGWVVCGASFLGILASDGLSSMFGIFTQFLVQRFDAPLSQVAIIGSVLPAMYNSSSIFTSILVDKFGCRPVCIAGGVICMASFGLSAVVNSTLSLLLTFDILGGIGLGFVYVPSVVCCNHYFKKRRSLANGISMAGCGVGIMALTPLFTWVLANHGWEGCCLGFMAIAGLCIVGGATMRPLEVVIDPVDSGSTTASRGQVQLMLDSSSGQGTVVLSPMALEDAFMGFTPGTSNEPPIDEEAIQQKKFKVFKSLEYLKNPLALTFTFMSFCNTITAFGSLQLLPSLYESLGFESDQISLAMGIYGTVSIVSRVCLTALLDLPQFNSLVMVTFAQLLACLVCFAMPHCTTSYSMYFVSGAFGLSVSGFYGPVAIVICDLFGVKALTSIIGIVGLARGISAGIGAPLMGLIHDYSHTLEWAYYASAANCLVCFLMSLSMHLHRKK